MLELILVTSIFLIILNKKISNKYITVAVRSIQIIVSTYCISKNIFGPGAATLGAVETSSLMFFIVSVMFSFDIERLDYQRHIKELLFLLISIFLISSQLSVIILTTLFILTTYIYKRKSYFIDYISLSIISLITLIYFSELSTTVLTIKDSYYLYLTNISEIIFYPLILLFVVIEFTRLWGIKRSISTILTVLPLIFAYKFKLANNIEDVIIMVLAPAYLASIIVLARKVLITKSVSRSINYLFLVCLFTSFIYLACGQYESAIVSAIIFSLILTIYREASSFLEKEKELQKIFSCFALINFAALPLSFSGLALIDVISLVSNIPIYVYLIIGMIVSVITFSFTLKSNTDDLYVNLLESSNKMKITTVSLFIVSLLLIFMNLSKFLVSIENTKKLENLLFSNIVEVKSNAVFNYNLNFIIFLITVVVIGYLVKTITHKVSWKMAFKLDEILRNFSFNKYLVRVSSFQSNRIKIESPRERSEIEVSSFKVSFFILTIFLIISLIIIEL